MPAPFRPRITTRDATVHCHIDIRENLKGSVGLREFARHQRRLAAGRWLGETQARNLVARAHRLQAAQDSSGSLVHALRGARLRRLRAHPVGLLLQRIRLAFGVSALATASTLIGLTLLEVRAPADVVHIERRAVRIEVKHPIDCCLKQGHVVADDDESASMRPQEVAQPHDGVCVEMVGRLIEEQCLDAGEEDPGQFDSATLTTGQRPQGLFHDPIGQSETRGDRVGLRLGRVSAARQELSIRVCIAAHGPVPDLVIAAGHRVGRLAHPGSGHIQSTSGQNPVSGQDI